MPVGICIIAHEPLASALKQCAQHVWSVTGDSSADDIATYDVPSDIDIEIGVAEARRLINTLPQNNGIIVFTDLMGSTPSNIAHKLLDNEAVRVITGVNLNAVIAALNAPKGDSANRVMTMAESGGRAGISSSIGRS